MPEFAYQEVTIVVKVSCVSTEAAINEVEDCLNQHLASLEEIVDSSAEEV
jgi:hypothetical protein